MKIKRVLELTNEEKNAYSEIDNMLSTISVEDEEENFCNWIKEKCFLIALNEIINEDPIGFITDLKTIFEQFRNCT